MASHIKLWKDGFHLGKELLETEFKIISLNPLIGHLSELIEKKTFTEIHNALVHQSVKLTIKKYFAKYFSAMSRTNTGDEFGKLYLGVNDDGLITGFPVTTKLEEYQVRSIINEIIKENIRGINDGSVCDDTKRYFSERISVNIYDIDHQNYSCDDFSLDEFMSNVESEEEEYEQRLKDYLQKKDQWRKHIKKYNVKLYTLSNDEILRSELLEYCIENEANDEILSMLKSEDEIKIELGVAERKYDPENFDYWVANFKEVKLNEIKRPYEPHRLSTFGRARFKRCLNNPLQMSPYWNNIHYQFIEIILPMNAEEDCWIEYLEDSEWVSRVREIKDSGDPCCRRL